MSMLLHSWPANLRAAIGDPVLRDYLCLDTEYIDSSGDGLLLEFGYARVTDGGQTVKQRSVTLNWYAVPGISRTELDYRLGRMADHVPGWKFSSSHVRKEGVDPFAALKGLKKLTDIWASTGGLFVLQNGLKADEFVIRHALARAGHKEFRFPEDRYVDTGGLFLAEQVWSTKDAEIAKYRPSVVPHRSETLRGYFHRLTNLKIKGVSWKLKVIMDTYKIKADAAEAWHTAGYDALCLHEIVNHWCNLMKAV
jgi:hypothetical protein